MGHNYVSYFRIWLPVNGTIKCCCYFSLFWTCWLWILFDIILDFFVKMYLCMRVYWRLSMLGWMHAGVIVDAMAGRNLVVERLVIWDYTIFSGFIIPIDSDFPSVLFKQLGNLWFFFSTSDSILSQVFAVPEIRSRTSLWISDFSKVRHRNMTKESFLLARLTRGEMEAELDLHLPSFSQHKKQSSWACVFRRKRIAVVFG